LIESWLSLYVEDTLIFTSGEWQPTLSAERKILVAAKAAHYRRPQSFGDDGLK